MNLETTLLQLVRKYMQQRLGETDVAQMFLARAADHETARRRLTRAFAEAESALESPESPPDSLALLAVPPGNAAETFLQLVQGCLPQAQLSVIASPDDILFFREQVTVPLKCVPHLNQSSRETYEQLVNQQCPLHARTDIRQWYRPDMM